MDSPAKQVYIATVLAIDDDPSMLEIISLYLTLKGLRVLTTSDPEKAISLVLKEKPRLILSDIAMPGMDGLTLLKALKANRSTSDIPVILLTSSTDTQDMQVGLDSGAEAYLVKPVDWDSHWPKIQAILLRS